ncbi:MAG: hypothetical protein ACFE0R_17830 [Salinarimonas sp.]
MRLLVQVPHDDAADPDALPAGGARVSADFGSNGGGRDVAGIAMVEGIDGYPCIDLMDARGTLVSSLAARQRVWAALEAVAGGNFELAGSSDALRSLIGAGG